MAKKTKKSVDELSLDELREELARREAEQLDADMTSIELGIEEAADRFKHQTLDARIQRLGKESFSKKPCPRCGRLVRVRTRGVSRTVRTLSGELTFKRNYHYCDRCKTGFYPRDRELGLPEEGRVSFELVTETYEDGTQAGRFWAQRMSLQSKKRRFVGERGEIVTEVPSGGTYPS